ncbi:MAG: dephospho-CoA kinase [Anaeroplasmataceae bacterium]|nr:dephospho-CoA kinase [Anaeroplasmataceae bacterium]
MRKVVGITGGIASGKSTVCQYLASLGYPVIDSDKISKNLSQKGMPLYEAIRNAFGDRFLKKNLELDRQKFGHYVFEHPEELSKLNAISHPLIVEEIKKMLKKMPDTLIFLDIPLLFEAKLSYLCDTIVCVYVNEETQIKRLMERDGISKEYAELKISAQMPLDEKRKRSNYVVESMEDINRTKENIHMIIMKLKGE